MYVCICIYIYIEDIPTSIGDFQIMVLPCFRFYHFNIHHLGNLLGRHGPFTSADFPIKNGDLPVRYVVLPGAIHYIPSYHIPYIPF